LSDVLTLTETTFSVQDFFNGSEVSKDLTMTEDEVGAALAPRKWSTGPGGEYICVR
jgi:hypothetical protein